MENLAGKQLYYMGSTKLIGAKSVPRDEQDPCTTLTLVSEPVLTGVTFFFFFVTGMYGLVRLG